MGEAGGSGGMAADTDLILRSSGAASQRMGRGPHGFETREGALLTVGDRGRLKKPNFRSRRTPGTPLNCPNRARRCLTLDFPGLAAMFAQPLGSPGGYMRNKITKLLIVVVPRRTAGDG